MKGPEAADALEIEAKGLIERAVRTADEIAGSARATSVALNQSSDPTAHVKLIALLLPELTADIASITTKYAAIRMLRDTKVIE